MQVAAGRGQWGVEIGMGIQPQQEQRPVLPRRKGRSPGDADCIITLTVAKRTAKRITTTDGKVLGVQIIDGIERVKPWGTYSMCPVIGAERRA
jgi:hypothetical protein